MQMRGVSKSLDAILARATFTASKLGATSNYEEILFLELLANRNSLGYEYLSSKIDPERLEEIRREVTQRIMTTYEPTELSIAGITPEMVYQDLVSGLLITYPDAKSISSLHALHYIASDEAGLIANELLHEGLTPLQIEQEMVEYSLKYGASPSAEPNTVIHQRRTSSHPLAKFGIDLTALAREGKIDPVIGREKETQRMIQILSRRKKSNPVLIGEAGVGKTAIVEGLALMMVRDDAPRSIRNKTLFSIDVSALVAGSKFRGDFEERMQQLITALSESKDTIIFIDEIHTIVGAGSSQGSLDTANILKPAMARGDIQTIGATTLDEYRNNIEKDAALERRLQKILIEPTTEEQTIEILNKIVPKYEVHHGVKYSVEAIKACVSLSERYITERHLPDKAIDLLDEAGAVNRMNNKLRENETPIIGRSDIERIITSLKGIPLEKITSTESVRLRGLASYLQSKVVGQDESVERIARTIRRSKAGLAEESRPIGVFLFVGPTGVGKTLLAKELTKWMFDSYKSIIRFDMSEYSQAHSTSRLIGSPPGYVGYGDGGELTEAVRINPYSVVLFDEIEKAHSDVYDMMLQIFDDGHITDSSGRLVDFKNTIIIMTSNAGANLKIRKARSMGFVHKTTTHLTQEQEKYRIALEQHFNPEFLGRVDDVLIFNPLNIKSMHQIVNLELNKIFERTQKLGYNIRITEGAKAELANMGSESKYGARFVKRLIMEKVEEPLADLIIDGVLKKDQTVVIELKRNERDVRLRVDETIKATKKRQLMEANS